MKKSAAFFDLDKTIYNEHSFFPLTKFLVDRGLLSKETWDKVGTELGRYKNSRQTYSVTANKLLRIFGLALGGMKYKNVLEATKEFFEVNRKNFYSYFGTILPEIQKTHDVVLVTTNSQMVAEAVVDMWGLQGYLSTQFEVIDGKFSGNILSTLADGKQVVGDLVKRYEGETMAFGDSENDVGMMELVNIPVCVNPGDALLNIAGKKGWKVVNDQSAASEILNMLNKH